MLHARIIPPDGADTQFADTRAAYDALPEATKAKLEGLIAEHSIWHSRAQLGGYTPTEDEIKARPPARHPVVRRHPGSHRNALYIASHASHIIGWPVEEGRALLRELLAHATQPRFVYAHKWRLGDLVIWDNRCTLHRATPFESSTHVRDMRRSTVIDRSRRGDGGLRRYDREDIHEIDRNRRRACRSSGRFIGRCADRVRPERQLSVATDHHHRPVPAGRQLGRRDPRWSAESRRNAEEPAS